MKTLIITVIAIMAILGWNSARAEKPELRGFMASPDFVPCPDEKNRPCVMITNGEVLYVVKGKGYGKEETIWEVDWKKMEKDNEQLDMTKYLKVVWRNPDGMI